jgi:para-nitrobenzyl esterase
MQRKRWSLPLLGLLVSSLLLACGSRHAAADRPTPDAALHRTTTSGDVAGFIGRYGSAVWLGIPYAAPPVGPQRWRAPAPPPRWDGVRDAVAPASPCVQYASRFGGLEDLPRGAPAGAEDCLYLNVYAPRSATPGTGRLPVMVWIHGGGNVVGHAGFFDGGNLAAREDVVVVTINYRLGPFGWFRHPALRDAGASELDRSGNFGTLDQVRALEWVRDNAEAFGGDPGNVTVFGESAGGTDVFALLLAPPARGLFHRAIVESGNLFFGAPATAEGFVDDPQPSHPNASGEAAARMLVAAGGAADRVAAKAKLAAMPPEETAAWLRSQPAYDVMRAFPIAASGEMVDVPRMFRDGTVLPAEDPLVALGRDAGHAHVPVLVGTNRDENKLFMFASPALVRRWFGVIPRLRDAATYQLDAEYLARLWKATGADEPAAALSASQREPVFVYRFDWDEEPTILGADLPQMLGAAHGFEIPFVFGHFDLGREASRIFTADNAQGREALSSQMMGYWAQFARTGDPGRGTAGTQPEWPPWHGSPRFLVLDTPDGGGIRASTEGVTSRSVVAAVDADPRLATQRDRCRVFHTLASWGRGFDRSAYPTAGAHGCADFPFDGFAAPG